jgi:hypothetical protein
MQDLKSGNIVKGYIKRKLGIATTAHEFARQVNNFWQFVCSMFGDDSWLAKKIHEVYKITNDFVDEIESLTRSDSEYILQLASVIDHTYHFFLTTCVNADGDIGKVDWTYLENLPDEIKNFIRKRAHPNFILTRMIRRIADQTLEEQKRKLQVDGVFEPSGHSVSRKRRKRNYLRQK